MEPETDRLMHREYAGWLDNESVPRPDRQGPGRRSPQQPGNNHKLRRWLLLVALFCLGCLPGVGEQIMPDKQQLEELSSRFKLTVNQAVYSAGGELQELDLAGSRNLTGLNLGSFLRLRSVNMSDCGLVSLEDIRFPPSLERLNLSWNEALRQVAVPQLTHLTWLNLSYCGLESLRTPQLPAALEVLELGGNTRLKTLHLENLAALRQLDCSDTPLTSLNLRSCRQLEQLYLRSNKKLSSLVLLDFPGLKRLDLARGRLESLVLSHLPALEELLVNDNPALHSLTLTHLHNLKTLIASGCGFKELERLQLPPGLEKLDLSSNKQLRQVAFSGLEKLNSLSLITGNLESITVQGLPLLTILDLGENRLLRKLSLAQLPSLRYLHLYKSGLTNLTLKQLPALQELYLTDSAGLTRLTLQAITTLTKLVAPSCDLREITLPSSLEVLDLQHNPEYRPPDLRPFVHLKQLFLRGCDLSGFSADQLPAGIEAASCV